MQRLVDEQNYEAAAGRFNFHQTIWNTAEKSEKSIISWPMTVCCHTLMDNLKQTSRKPRLEAAVVKPYNLVSIQSDPLDTKMTSALDPRSLDCHWSVFPNLFWNLLSVDKLPVEQPRGSKGEWAGRLNVTGLFQVHLYLFYYIIQQE